MATIRESQDRAGRAELTSLTGRLQNPNYMARIVYQTQETGNERDSTGVISLYLPENFQLNFSSSFDQPFAQGLVNMPGLQQAAKMFGASLTSQSMSVQVWQGTTCPEFNLTFQLVAENDPQIDVVNPTIELAKLASPGLDKTTRLLTPPGPRIDPLKVATALPQAAGALASGTLGTLGALAGTVTGDFSRLVPSLSATAQNVGQALQGILDSPKNNVTLYIGRFLKFPSVVIQSVSQTYNTLFNEQGLPIKADVDVTFSTWYVPVKDDIDKIFQRT